MVQVTLMHNVLAVDHTLVNVLLPAYISDLPLFFFFFSPDLPSHPEWKVEDKRVNIDESSRCRGAFDKCWPCSVMWGMCLITVKQV